MQRSLVERVFGWPFRVKRLAPGEVIDRGAVETEELALASTDLLHDCSTLGGCSGSCVVEMSEHKVIGLHYFGTQFVANEAVDLAQLGQELPAGDLNLV
jgi:hypothetical protein